MSNRMATVRLSKQRFRLGSGRVVSLSQAAQDALQRRVVSMGTVMLVHVHGKTEQTLRSRGLLDDGPRLTEDAVDLADLLDREKERSRG